MVMSRGIKVLAAAYRDAGMEVIYLGLRQTPEMIVSSSFARRCRRDCIIKPKINAHNTNICKCSQFNGEKGLDNVLLVGGGIIPKNDMEVLENKGVGKLFGPGTPVQETIDYITNWVKSNRR